MDELAQTREALGELIDAIRAAVHAKYRDPHPFALISAMNHLHDLAEATAEDYELDLDAGASAAERQTERMLEGD